MPAQVHRGSGRARRLPAAVILLTAVSILALSLAPAGPALATGGATWKPAHALSVARYIHTATLLPNGKVLVVGGRDADSNSTNTALLYDPGSDTWSSAGPLITPRDSHTATLLPDGTVLVAGGHNSNTSSDLDTAQVYTPNSGAGTWSGETTFTTARYSHTATLLPNGQVLVAGGQDASGVATASCELFDYAAGTWTSTGSLPLRRAGSQAILLPSGKVLVTGGLGENNASQASCELYDPVSGTWTVTGSLATARWGHTATLLPKGKVLVAGGIYRAGGNDTTLGSCELYDPATGLWSTTGSFNTYREFQTATLLPNGRVLAAGGYQSNTAYYLASTELYDPAAGTWTATADLNHTSAYHTATLLPNGKVLVAGGRGGGGWLSLAQLFDPGLGFAETYRPTLSTISSPVTTGGQLYLTSQGVGTGFWGISGGSGGNTSDSPTDYPLVQLRRLDSERQFWVPGSSFSNGSFTSQTLQDIQTGYYLVSVYASGIPSLAQFTQLINTGPPTAVQLKSFTATGSNKYVQLNWQTGAEIDTAAFRLWRRDGAQGDYAPNNSLFPAKGGPSRGAKYSYKDTQVIKGHTYYYKLEDIARTGSDTFHGPVSATVGPVKKASR
jgi:hypothetical protein